MRIYLSKSNCADPTLYGIVRQLLVGTGHEIVEFTGGEYDNRALLSCYWLVIVPPSISVGYRDGWFRRVKDAPYHVGKGQQQQITDFISHTGVATRFTPQGKCLFTDCGKSNPILLVTQVSADSFSRQNTLQFSELRSYTLKELDWKERWSELGPSDYANACYTSYFPDITTKGRSTETTEKTMKKIALMHAGTPDSIKYYKAVENWIREQGKHHVINAAESSSREVNDCDLLLMMSVNTSSYDMTRSQELVGRAFLMEHFEDAGADEHDRYEQPKDGRDNKCCAIIDDFDLGDPECSGFVILTDIQLDGDYFTGEDYSLSTLFEDAPNYSGKEIRESSSNAVTSPYAPLTSGSLHLAAAASLGIFP